jgi:hypothetical protein
MPKRTSDVKLTPTFRKERERLATPRPASKQTGEDARLYITSAELLHLECQIQKASVALYLQCHGVSWLE